MRDLTAVCKCVQRVKFTATHTHTHTHTQSIMFYHSSRRYCNLKGVIYVVMEKEFKLRTLISTILMK